jgi:hypothetical protein
MLIVFKGLRKDVKAAAADTPVFLKFERTRISIER